MNSTFLENYCHVVTSQLHYLICLSCFTYATSIYVYLVGSLMGLKITETNKTKHMNSEEVDETCS